MNGPRAPLAMYITSLVVRAAGLLIIAHCVTRHPDATMAVVMIGGFFGAIVYGALRALGAFRD